MSEQPLTPDEQQRLYEGQQQVIIELLETHHGREPAEIDAALRQALANRGLGIPPEPWLGAVVGAVAEDRLYVVAPGAVPEEYYGSASAERAAERVDDRLRGREADPDDTEDVPREQDTTG